MFKRIASSVALIAALSTTTMPIASASTEGGAVQTPLVAKAATLPPQQERFRKCVVKRESGGNPKAQNPTSSAQGKYQFLDNSWRRGLSFMVVKHLRKHDIKIPGLRRELGSKPIKTWKPVYQDIAFAAVLNARGPWSGAHHWHLQNSSCGRWLP